MKTLLTVLILTSTLFAGSIELTCDEQTQVLKQIRILNIQSPKRTFTYNEFTKRYEWRQEIGDVKTVAIPFTNKTNRSLNLDNGYSRWDGEVEIRPGATANVTSQTQAEGLLSCKYKVIQNESKKTFEIYTK